MGEVPLSRVAGAGIKMDGAASAKVKVWKARKGGRSRDSEDTEMWPTRKILPTWWHHVMRVLVVIVALTVSGCTARGHSSSVPAAYSPEEGLSGPMIQGDGNGGGGM